MACYDELMNRTYYWPFDVAVAKLQKYASVKVWKACDVNIIVGHKSFPKSPLGIKTCAKEEMQT